MNIKNLLAFVFLVLVIVLIGFPNVSNFLYKDVLGLGGSKETTSQLNFKSINGEYKIYINDTEIGEVQDGLQNIFPLIEPGENTLKVVRQSDVEDFFYVLERRINFISGSEVKVEWEAGPSLSSSSGVIQYYKEINSNDGTRVLVSPFPKDSKVEFNSRTAQDNLVLVTSIEDQNIKVSNDNGFENKELTVNLQDGDSEQVLNNLQLVIEVFLYRQPFT